jgi:hypothetical protein
MLLKTVVTPLQKLYVCLISVMFLGGSGKNLEVFVEDMLGYVWDMFQWLLCGFV